LGEALSLATSIAYKYLVQLLSKGSRTLAHAWLCRTIRVECMPACAIEACGLN
jgi:hypothetical protein